MDRVAEERQTDRLGADTAGAVQNGVRSRSDLRLNQPIERRGLASHRSVPIGKDQMVALGQFVVERPHRVGHWRIEPVSKLHRTRRFVAASGAKPTVRASTSE